MHKPVLVILISILFTLTAQAETVTRNVPLTRQVTRIYLNGAYELYLTQGEEEYVRLTAPEDMISTVNARIQGKSLYLGREVNWDSDGLGHDRTPLRFDVQLRQVDAVRVLGSGRAHIGDLTSDWLKIIIAGSGKVDATNLRAGELHLETAGSCEFKGGSIMASDFGIEIGGSADVEISRLEAEVAAINVAGSADITLSEITALKVDTEISGSADIEMRGTVSRQELELNGDSDYQAKDLVSDSAYVEIRGSGDAELNVRKQLTAELSPGANLIFQGGTELEVDISGRGKYRRTDTTAGK
jgi:hypothetical protein